MILFFPSEHSERSNLGSENHVIISDWEKHFFDPRPHNTYPKIFLTQDKLIENRFVVVCSLLSRKISVWGSEKCFWDRKYHFLWNPHFRSQTGLERLEVGKLLIIDFWDSRMTSTNLKYHLVQYDVVSRNLIFNFRFRFFAGIFDPKIEIKYSPETQ